MAEEKELISFDQAEAVVEFAKALYAGDKFGYYSPFLSNQLLQNLNNNPKIPTSNTIRKALADYKNNAEDIQSYMEYMKVFDMLFNRTLYSYVNALSFDLSVVCTNAFTKDDYESDAYKADKKAVNDFLNKFAYKTEFRKVLQQVMTNEVYYVWFRKTKWGNKGMKFALQILPQNRCMLTGYWEKGLLFDFDMNYFLQAGVDIRGYDPAFKKYYDKVFNPEDGEYNYRPTSQLNSRTGTFALWTQTSPEDGAWCFKFDTSNFNATPFLAPFLKNAITNDEIQQLQYNKDIASAYAILAGEIGTYDTAQSGTKSDQFKISPKTLGGFMSKAKAGLSSIVKLAALPVEDIDFYQYEDKNKDMYNNQLKSSAGVGSNISRVIYSTDRMSNVEIEGAMNEVYQTMKPMYAQFGNFLDFFVNKLTKKYKFRFVFDGSNYPFERKNRFDQLTKMADNGIVLSPSYWASVAGIEPQLFDAMLLESKNSGWTDNLQLLLNSNTMRDESGGNGRPRKDSNELTDSGESSREMIEGE